jgi:hypothetical protein
MSVTGARAYRGLRWVHRRRRIPAPSECRSDKGRTKGRHACNDQNIFEGDIHNDQIKSKFVGWVNVKLMAGWLTCCLIEKDTEADAPGSAGEFHCLIIADTVANARRDEQTESR